MALERFVYEPTPVSGSRKTTEASDLTARDSDVAIKIHHLSKVFQSKWSLLKREKVTAIEDLTLDIPRFGIFVLLGSNG
jgi:ATP-binding cassette subfamily A (ABC1) protein 3